MRRVPSVTALLTALWLIAPTASHAADANGNFAIRGAGSATCASYISSSPREKLYAQTWWAGYLTAMNRVTPKTYNLLGKISVKVADDWLLKYCQQNPNARFAVAVHEMLKNAYPTRTQSGQ